MPHRDDAPLGAPVWIDLFTTEPEKTKPFYVELFGWTVDDPGPDFGGYVNFHKDGEPVAGCMKNNGESPIDVWSVYLATDDIEATAAKVTANGGEISVPPMDVMALGKMAVVVDAGQAMVGVWEPGEHRGFTLIGEPGAPAWFELHTREYDKAIAFYEAAFGWDARVMADEDGFRYTTANDGDDQVAGVMDRAADLPEGVPSHWAVYFGVEACDAAADQVVALGGSVLEPPVDTPYGRLAHVADPTGAAFRLIQPPA